MKTLTYINSAKLTIAASALILGSVATAEQFRAIESNELISDPDQLTTFGLVIGKDKLSDVAEKAIMREVENCDDYNRGSRCKYKYEPQETQLIDFSSPNKSISVYNNNETIYDELKLFSTKFYINGEWFIGTFSNDVLICIELSSANINEVPDDLNIANLVASLNKKYIRKKDQIFSRGFSEGFATKDIVYQWNSSDNRTVILLHRQDLILVNKASCLVKLKRALDVSLNYYNRIRHICDGNSTHYRLQYRAAPLYSETYTKARQLLANKSAEENATSKSRAERF